MKRPFGLTLIASVLTCAGGAMTMVMIIEAIDALRMLGLQGIAIYSPMSLWGFLLYGLTPVLFYTIGLGIFLNRKWAYVCLQNLVPVLLFFLTIHLTANMVRMAFYPHHVSLLRSVTLRPQSFIFAVLLCGVMIYPILVYLRAPFIREYFHMGGQNE